MYTKLYDIYSFMIVNEYYSLNNPIESVDYSCSLFSIVRGNSINSTNTMMMMMVVAMVVVVVILGASNYNHVIITFGSVHTHKMKVIDTFSS